MDLSSTPLSYIFNALVFPRGGASIPGVHLRREEKLEMNVEFLETLKEGKK